MLGLLGGLSFVSFPVMSALAQSPADSAEPVAPTARYAQGENVDLAEIVAEWRGYYDDVPVYQCVCLDGTCNQTEEWPYREFDRYQLSVSLGPNNATVTEAAGFNCFDIADGSRPSDPRAFSAALSGSADSENEATASAIARPANPAEQPASEPAVTAPVRPPAPSTSQSEISQSEISQSEISQSESSDSPASASSVLVATAINDGADIRLDWPSGSSNVVNVAGSSWNINVLDALDCESLSVVAQKMMVAQRVQGSPVVDAATGNVAVPVLLDSCVEVDQMAVFVMDPAEGGGYALYRTQLPPVTGALSQGTFAFPNEFSSYAYSTILEMRYWDRALLVRQGSASSAEAISIFRSGLTPAGIYAGCGVVSDLEGASALCDL